MRRSASPGYVGYEGDDSTYGRPDAAESGNWQPASFGARVAARLIDAAILTAIALVPVFVVLRVVISTHNDVFSATGGLLTALLVLELVPLVTYLVYRLGSDGGSGRSVGRAAVGIRLITLPPADATHPSRVGYWRAFGRLIASIVTDWLFFLGSLSMLWNAQKRTWADVAAGTAVVRDSTPRHGPGRVLTAALAIAAIVTAGAAITGVRERDNLDRQIAAANASLSTDGGTSTDTSPDVTDPGSTDGTSSTGTGPSATDPSSTDGTGTDGTSTNGTSTDGPTQVGSVQVDTSDPLSLAIGQSLDIYFSGINTQDYSAAWNQETAAQQARNGTFDQFSQQLATTNNTAIELHDSADNGDGTFSADVTFTSHQDASLGPGGDETCTDWTLDYSLVSDGSGGYLIDSVPTSNQNAC